MSVPTQEQHRHTYKAAVYDRKKEGKVDKDGKNAMSVVDLNLKLYDEATKAAKEDGAQIIVFPEWGLFGTSIPMARRETAKAFAQPIGNPGDDLTKLDDSFSVVRGLAAIAKNHEMVVVANICESVNDGEKLYNTEVAISEKGELLAKYHKMHPFFTRTFETPTKNEVVAFDTSFGVTFGLFICKDLYHSEPKNSLVEERGVTHLAYSVAVPFDNCLTRWHYNRFAKKHQATILVSNLGGGSGIFSSTGATVDKKDGYIIATINA